MEADSELICAMDVLPANADEAAKAKQLIAWEEGRVFHLLTSAKTVMVGPEGETTDGRSSGQVSTLSE